MYSERMNLNVDAKENITITNGVTEGLYGFLQSFLNPGDEVIVMEPGIVSFLFL